MQNTIHLLALLRFHTDSTNPELALAVVDAYARWVQHNGGYNIDAVAPQIMVCLPDPTLVLESMHALMHEGERFGFGVSAAVVQAIRSSDHIPRSPADFTERTLGTLLELAGSGEPQQLVISPKLWSLLQLAVPGYASLFESGPDAGARDITRVKHRLVMNARRLPPYQGQITICNAR